MRREPPEPELPTEWQLTTRPRVDLRSEEMAAFRDRALAGLRAAHGLGVAFDLGTYAGPDPPMILRCRTPSGARWVGRALANAYGRAAWVRRPIERREPPIDTVWGRRVRSWPEPLCGASEGDPTAGECLRLVMSGAAPGVSVFWHFSPARATWSRPLELGTSGWNPSSGFRVRGPHESLPSSRRPAVPVSVPSSPLFWKAEVAVDFPRPALSDRAMDNVLRGLESALRSSGGNGIRFPRWRFRIRPSTPWFFVAETELAGLMPRLDGGSAFEVVAMGTSRPGLPLGRTASGRVVGPPVEPGQGRHLAVLGETGMGKSSTLVAIARRAATLGGVILFDPLGETAASFRSGLSHEELSRLVSVSPQEGPCGINAIEGIGAGDIDPVQRERRLNDLVYALRRVRSGRYPDSSYWGPRLEEVLTRSVRAAAAFPEGTLVDAHTLLSTGGRTRQVVPPEAQDAVRELSERIRSRPDDAEGARRLLYEVVRSPVLHRMLCERNPPLRARDLVAPGRIVVISGEAAAVGESVARYLLAVYLAVVWAELLAREPNSKTFVVLDESEWFSHESLAEMLRLARRRNVHVILATQSVSSLPEPVAEAVWTNVSDFVAFRGSPEEARELARATRGVTVEEILALPRGQAAVLLGKGAMVAWLRTSGRPPTAGGRPPVTPREPVPTAEDDGGTGEIPGDPRTTVEPILEWLRARARTLVPGESLRVDLDDLRRSLDPAGRGVRTAGGVLARAGALLSSSREAGRPVWVLDPSKIPAPVGETVSQPLGGASKAPQPS